MQKRFGTSIRVGSPIELHPCCVREEEWCRRPSRDRWPFKIWRRLLQILVEMYVLVD
jgi:hypothetical protein